MRRRFLTAGALGALTLLVIAALASANRLSISQTRGVIGFGPLAILQGEIETRCDVIFSGSFHSSTIRKVLAALIGHVSRSIVSQPCAAGSATVLGATLPWHIVYGGFAGTLPRIGSVTLRLIGLALRIEAGFGACLGASTTTNPARAIAGIESGTGAVTSITADNTARIPVRGGFPCEFAGSATLEGTGATSGATVRLI